MTTLNYIRYALLSNRGRFVKSHGTLTYYTPNVEYAKIWKSQATAMSVRDEINKQYEERENDVRVKVVKIEASYSITDADII